MKTRSRSAPIASPNAKNKNTKRNKSYDDKKRAPGSKPPNRGDGTTHASGSQPFWAGNNLNQFARWMHVQRCRARRRTACAGFGAFRRRFRKVIEL